MRVVTPALLLRSVVHVLFACVAPTTMAQNTIRVSVSSLGQQANADCNAPSLSADGQIVAFESLADDLVPGDTNHTSDVFVVDRKAGTINRASVDSLGHEANGFSFFANVSADGKFVAFTSFASNLVAGDTNNTLDVFVHDLETGETTRVSVDSQGVQGDRESGYASVCSGGRYAAFQSMATNLVAGDTNSAIDVFVHDLITGETTRVSVDSQGNQANGESNFSSISADGLVVGFYSYATNLVAGDTNGHIDSFVHDRQTGQTERVSLDAQGNQFNADSYHPSLSGDGRFAAFVAPIGVVVHDRVTHVSTPIASGGSANISADGTVVAFPTIAALVPDDTNGKSDVYLYDLVAHTFTRASVTAGGAQGDGHSVISVNYCCVADAGSVVAFASASTNLVAGDTNGSGDVFVRITTCDPPDSGACLVAPANLVAWWPLDASPGQWMNDLTMQTGGWVVSAMTTAGVVDEALAFDGAYDGVGVGSFLPPVLDLGSGDFSLVAWIKTKATDGSYPIVSKRWPSTVGFDLRVLDGKLAFTIADGKVTTITGTRPVADGCWHLVAVTVDRDDPQGGRLYVDGVLDVAGDITAYSGSINTTTALRIGAMHGSSVSFLGSIDEVQLFARSLTSAEIDGVYQAGVRGVCKPACMPAPPMVVAWWPLDDPGNIVTDVNGCANGVLTGTPLPDHLAGAVSGALAFMRKSWVKVADSDCLDIGTSDFSLEAWIMPTGSVFGVSSILDKRSFFAGYHLFLSSGRLGVQLRVGGSSVNWIGGPTLAFGRWHHVAATVQRSSTTGGHLYVDGDLVLTFDPSTMQGDLANSVDLLIGGHRDTPAMRFMGAIDEVTLYQSVLSQANVQSIFAAGAAGKCKP